MTLLQAPDVHRPVNLTGRGDSGHGPPGGSREAGRPGEAFSAAGVVHDLGNLIQIAASAINIVARSPGMPATHSGPMLHRARTCLEHAGALVRQTIGLARDRALADAHCNVSACLAGVAILVEAMSGPGLVLEVEVEPDLPGLPCDPLGLQNAVLNLVFNARDAMAGKGFVAIRGRAISSGPAEAGVEIRVTDDGIGMSLATIARAFDPFFTTKSDGLGGIGLPMVERFVRDAGGDILIDSEPGTGTTVILRLPAVAGAATGQPVRAASIPDELDR